MVDESLEDEPMTASRQAPSPANGAQAPSSWQTWARSIEDNDLDYVLQTAGYQYAAMDRLGPGELMRHDQLCAARAEQLQDESAQDLAPLMRWAVSRAWRGHQAHDQAHEWAMTLLQTPAQDRDALLCYEEVLWVTVLYALSQGRLEQAEQAVRGWAQAQEQTPGQAQDKAQAQEASPAQEQERRRQGQTLPERAHALVELAQGQLQLGQERLEALLRSREDDPELCFDVAQDLERAGHIELAMQWLDRSEALALKRGMRALSVDIALMRGDGMSQGGLESGADH